jgi:hypothetical protein
MHVSSDKKIIILLPPKTASNSVQTAFTKSGIRFQGGTKKVDYPTLHLKLSELCEFHDLTNIQDYTILQFTRNPYYRFVSSYFHLMRLPINKTSASFYNMEFKEFIHHLNKSKLSNDFIKTFFGNDSDYYENIRLKKNWSGVRLFEEQVSWNDLNAKIHYFKIEDVSSDMSPISDLLSCNPMSMEFLNKNPKDVDYDSLLDDECMEIIHRNFINDFKILKY